MSKQFIVAFLDSGAEATAMATLADKIGREENPDVLDNHSNNILDAIIETKDADQDRIRTAFAASYICAFHTGLVYTQNGKSYLQHMTLPRIPFQYDDKWYFDTEKNEWFIPPSKPERHEDKYVCRDSYGDLCINFDLYEHHLRKHRQLLAELDSACETATGQNHWIYRYKTNQKSAKEGQENLNTMFENARIKKSITEIVQIAKRIRQLSVDRQMERGLLFSVAELHLSNLYTLAETFIRHVRVRTVDEWQMNALMELFEKHIKILHAETGYFTGVSGAYGLSILTAAVDILHDLQIFLKGQLHELRRTQMLQKIASTLEEIRTEVACAVSVLKNIQADIRSTNELLHDNNRSLQGIKWLEQKQLIGLGALGMVMSSMRFEQTTHHESSGFLGLFRSSSTRHTSGGPRIQFNDAYRFLEQQGSRGLLSTK